MVKELKEISSLVCSGCMVYEDCQKDYNVSRKCWQHRLINVIRELVNNKWVGLTFSIIEHRSLGLTTMTIVYFGDTLNVHWGDNVFLRGYIVNGIRCVVGYNMKKRREE